MKRVPDSFPRPPIWSVCYCGGKWLPASTTTTRPLQTLPGLTRALAAPGYSGSQPTEYHRTYERARFGACLNQGRHRERDGRRRNTNDGQHGCEHDDRSHCFCHTRADVVPALSARGSRYVARTPSAGKIRRPVSRGVYHRRVRAGKLGREGASWVFIFTDLPLVNSETAFFKKS